MTVGMKPFSCPRCDKIFEDYKMLHEGTNTGDFQVSSLKRQSKLFQVQMTFGVNPFSCSSFDKIFKDYKM